MYIAVIRVWLKFRSDSTQINYKLFLFYLCHSQTLKQFPSNKGSNFLYFSSKYWNFIWTRSKKPIHVNPNKICQLFNRNSSTLSVDPSSKSVRFSAWNLRHGQDQTRPDHVKNDDGKKTVLSLDLCPLLYPLIDAN